MLPARLVHRYASEIRQLKLRILTEILVAALFLSALVFFINRLRLYFLLSRKGVKIIFGFAGIPGYLESLYTKSGNLVRDSVGDQILKINKISFCFVAANAILLFLLVVFN